MPTLTPGVEAALAETYRGEFALRIQFPDVTFRVWSGTQDITIDGELYLATGVISPGNTRIQLGTISEIADTSDMSDQPIDLTLSGLAPEILSELRNYAHQGSPVTIYEIQFDDDFQVIPDPYVVLSGFIDTMSMMAADTLTITVRVISLLRMAFLGPDGHRRTQADQEMIFKGSGDLGLEFASRLKEQIPWMIPHTIAVRRDFGNI